MGFRTTLAVLVGRAVRVAARARGGGSAIPGVVASRIDPSFLRHTVARIPLGVVAVSGSNGKSTTTNMLAAMLRAHGLKVFTNPSGGNLPQGIASAVLADASLGGRIDADIAVLEIDEGYGVGLSELLRPRSALLLNVQIDQLNRFHEPERVVGMLAVLAGVVDQHLVLNRDDNHLADLDQRLAASPGRTVSMFGVEPALLKRAGSSVSTAMRFDGVDAAAAMRPAAVEVVALAGTTATLTHGETRFDVQLPSRGLHYAVDAAGAAAMTAALVGDRFDPALVRSALDGLPTVYGRGEVLHIGDEDVEVIMMKNPASLQLNLDALPDTPEQVLMAVDEGTPDPSWIYDMDLSSLTHVDIMTGSKAYQFALRLAYGGLPVGEVDLDIKAAVQRFLALPRPKQGLKTMILNYEQMMSIRTWLGYKELEGGSK